jgi:hypothetical protein
MAELDQAARYALKLAPDQLIAWLLPGLDPDLVFRRWLDTKMIAFPGEPGRRCDTVAELVSRTGGQGPWALVVEAEARLRADLLARVLEYLGRLKRRVRHGPEGRDRYPVAAVVLLLTGRGSDLKLDGMLPGTDVGLSGKVRIMSLEAQSAEAVLSQVGSGKLGVGVLPWVPLMTGAGETSVVAEWVRLARMEPVDQRRSDYAGLALVFAERAGCLPVWKQALEGWEMWQSQVVKRWKDEGRAEGRAEGMLTNQRNNLLQALRHHLKVEIPPDLVALIEQTTDMEVLKRWFSISMEVSSMDDFRHHLEAP